MTKSKSINTLLIVAGTIGTGIGGALLFAPVAFEASAGIHLPQDANLLSELRAPGGALLTAGILIVSGAFTPKMTYLSLVLSSLFYLSYGLSRVLSMVLDGVPESSLMVATAAELIIGLLSLMALIHFDKKRWAVA